MATTTTNFGWDIPQSTDLVKDGATAIAALGQDIDTALVDLKGGTTGQYLVKASNTDLDYSWTTSTADIEGVTATSPLTGGGTSGTVTIGIQDASTSQKGAVQLTDSTSSTSTTTAATPNSVKSAYDLANSKGMTSLASGTLSGASVVLSSISGSYNQLQLVVTNYKPATNTATLFMRVNADSTANRYSNVVTGSGSFTFNSTGWQLSSSQSNTTDTGTIVVDLFSYTSTTTYKTAMSMAITDSGGTNYYVNQNLIYNQTGAITSLTLLPSSGNFTSGNYVLYGVK